MLLSPLVLLHGPRSALKGLWSFAMKDRTGKNAGRAGVSRTYRSSVPCAHPAINGHWFGSTAARRSLCDLLALADPCPAGDSIGSYPIRHRDILPRTTPPMRFS